jgi:protein-tyrosine sulfotransferase
MLSRYKHLVPLLLVKVFGRLQLLLQFFRLGYPMAGTELSCQPFFIVGCGRSGNTLLRSMLCADNQVAIPPESYVIPKVIKQFARYSFLPWEELSGMIVSEFETYKEFYTWGVNLSEAHRKVRGLKGKKRTLANIIDVVYQEFDSQKCIGAGRWADKTPINTIFLDKIFQVFPKAKYVHIVRDPRATAASYLKSGLLSKLDQAVWFWNTSVGQFDLVAQKKNSLVLEVKYEYLVAHPDVVLRDVCGFLGLEFRVEMFAAYGRTSFLGDVGFHSHHKNVGKPIIIDGNRKWREQFGDDELKYIKKSCAGKAKKHGYIL